MGHERIGYLPKSKKWRSIVEEVANFTSDEDTIAKIANQTTKNVLKRYDNIESDQGVLSAFKFLVLLSKSAREKDSSDFLAEHGIDLPRNFNLLKLSKEIRDFIDQNTESKEYSSFANHALIDTISQWSQKNRIQTQIQFETDQNSFDEWKSAASASGFCELSRMFFANFTDTYLKYFLEREASANINNLFDRDTFNKKLENHLNEISKHAFETAKIPN
ncbi:MAG: hypothetical protein RLN88_08725 [Ekhidna sp.]|uniref:hypothetical protein n=1 Tax=Ekhidna sp. TaxID=2608089 RepID=UPI0032EFE369